MPVLVRRNISPRFESEPSFEPVDVLPWSDTRCELRIIPFAGGAFWQWTQGRRHRYWRLAHAAADHLAGTLTTTHRNGAPTCRI